MRSALMTPSSALSVFGKNNVPKTRAEAAEYSRNSYHSMTVPAIDAATTFRSLLAGGSAVCGLVAGDGWGDELTTVTPCRSAWLMGVAAACVPDHGSHSEAQGNSCEQSIAPSLRQIWTIDCACCFNGFVAKCAHPADSIEGGTDG